MPVVENTANRGYQLPHPTNNLDYDIARLRASFTAIDADVASLLTSVAGKAATSHTHVISDVSGLQSALDAKMAANASLSLDFLSDVDTAGAASNMFLRFVNGAWVPVAFDASMVASGTLNINRMPAHGHSIAEVTALQAALDGKANLANGNQFSGSQAFVSGNIGFGTATPVAAFDNANSRTALGKDAVGAHWLRARDIASEPNNLSYGFLSNGSFVTELYLSTYGQNRITVDQNGKVTIAGIASSWDASLDLLPSTHGTSERACVRYGNWFAGQDWPTDGTKDFFIYTDQNGGRVVRIDPWGTVIADSYAINGLTSCFFSKNIGSGNPGIAWDGNDYIQYDRGNNVMYFGIGGVTRTYMSGGDIYLNDPFVPGWFRLQTSGYHAVYRNSSVATEGIVDYSSNWGATGRNVYRVQSNGNVLNYNNSYGSLSDQSLKENIADATPKLADVMNIRIRNFNMKGDADKHIGVVAQEIEQVFPKLVETDKNGIKSVKYSVLVPILIKALQELKTEFDTYKLAHP